MTYTYTWPADRKPAVRKVLWMGRPCWAAGRPGRHYFAADGWHFNRWEYAMMHALGWYPTATPLGWAVNAESEQ